ncbi:MAG: GAF domain-containing protein [Ardenticatenaceae bacterium]|nr:GAF domain-containing protein [Ardenticatenaceae bacterium]
MLYNRPMFNSQSARPQAMNALREIARALSNAWDLDTTLDLIVRKTTEVMHVDSCTIYLLDSDGGTLRLQASTGLANRALGRATLAVGEGMTGYAVQSNQPVFARDAQHDPHFKWVYEAEETPFTSLLAVPLDIEGDVFGAMNVQTRTPHDFSSNEVALLSLIGDIAAGTLAKAQLYDKQKRQIEEMRALAQISEVVTSPQYLDDILDVVTEMAAKMMNTAVCAIFLLNETGTHLELRSARRNQTPYQHRPPLPVDATDSVIGSVLQTGQPLYIANVQTDPRYRGKELARQEGLISMLSVPLSVRDRVIGVFNCYTTESRQFGEEQQTLFATLANQTALAIENARLVTNTAVVREMHHRIKNNLQTVAMLMQLQLSEADRLNPREVLQTNIHRIRSIAAVHEILSEKGFRLVDVKDVLERITQATAETMTHPSQSLTIRVFGEALTLPSKPATAIALVVNELVQNSLEHAFADRSADGQIEVSLGRSPEEIIIIVRDNGSGMPDDLESGLGLEIVETLVQEDLNGRLKFNCPPQGGTEISLRLPRTIEQEIG